ncbi:alpha/beta fold hydrolase [Azospirillum halopraeferens]|uniref:alpha/beta fold hydrolase n=1 Tax=Azospirillum halopraeferens TaxID=34010 RepID=UPI00040BAC57|nr:alpha/beta fold hydrolase [Azospirillum halopraeferens]
MDRPALILLPGMPLDAALWEHQTRHLAEIADVSVGDLTGADSMAGLAAAVLAAAPPRFALAGLSLGGYVAMEILRRAPDRVERVALLDTNPYADTAEQSANRRAAAELAGRGRLRQVVAGHLPRLVHPDRLGDRPLVESVYAQAERIGADAYARQQAAIIGRPDSRASLKAVSCPALVVCGRQDALSPVEVHAEMAGLIPGARLAVVEDCGHLAAMEQPQAVTALLRLWMLYD